MNFELLPYSLSILQSDSRAAMAAMMSIVVVATVVTTVDTGVTPEHQKRPLLYHAPE